VARELAIGGARVKVRNPWGVLGLAIVTLGIYFFVWWYFVNRELRDFGREHGDAIPVDPVLSVLAVTIGVLLIVPPFVSAYRGGGRIKEAQRLAGLHADAMPALGLLLWILLQFVAGVYLQAQLNDAWTAAERLRAAA
jgi:hypothetical protein